MAGKFEYEFFICEGKMKRQQQYRRCAVLECESSAGDGRLFRFPRVKEQCEKWMEFTGDQNVLNYSWEAASKFFMCINHFTESNFANAEKKKRLKPGALPSIRYKYDGGVGGNDEGSVDFCAKLDETQSCTDPHLVVNSEGAESEVRSCTQISLQ